MAWWWVLCTLELRFRPPSQNTKTTPRFELLTIARCVSLAQLLLLVPWSSSLELCCRLHQTLSLHRFLSLLLRLKSTLRSIQVSTRSSTSPPPVPTPPPFASSARSAPLLSARPAARLSRQIRFLVTVDPLEEQDPLDSDAGASRGTATACQARFGTSASGYCRRVGRRLRTSRASSRGSCTGLVETTRIAA